MGRSRNFDGPEEIAEASWQLEIVEASWQQPAQSSASELQLLDACLTNDHALVVAHLRPVLPLPLRVPTARP